MGLKICHVAPVTPGGCGLYETTRELVLAERSIGIDACLIDPRLSERELRDMAMSSKPSIDVKCPKCSHDFKLYQNVSVNDNATRPPAWSDDRGVCLAPIAHAGKCDIIVSHSGLDTRFDAFDVPRIHVAHGRPNSSYRIERDGEHPIYTVYKKMVDDPRWKFLVTLWPGYEHYWSLVFPRVKVVNPFVDLARWNVGPRDYAFGGKRGEVNIVIADMWRKDADPFYPIHAFAKFAEVQTNAKLHVYGMDGNGRARDTLLGVLAERGVLGETVHMMPDLAPVYRAADMVITPHRIATRVVRESLACGTPVVAGSGNPYTQYRADPEDLLGFAEAMRECLSHRRNRPNAVVAECRQTAEYEFSPAKAAGAFNDIFQEVLA